MMHRNTKKKFNRTSAHKKAMFNNMLTSLIKHERVRTTKEKGRELKRIADKTIHRAKTDTVANRRIVAASVRDPKMVAKLFKEIAPRYANRNGGYTSKALAYKRPGDGAEMCYVSLVPDTGMDGEKK